MVSVYHQSVGQSTHKSKNGKLGYVAERVGFEPTDPQGVNGFRDRPIKPLSHLSVIF